MKKYFFLMALLAATSACGATPADTDTSDAGPDVLVPADLGRSPGCQIPEPRVKVMWQSTVSTKPRGGYAVLVGVPVCSTSYFPAPKDCSRPVDGFSDGSTWCCVPTVKNPDGTRSMNRPTVQCFDQRAAGPDEIFRMPGYLALCSVDGKFVGWDCTGDPLRQ